jgi:hypothetical protein
VVLFFIPTRKYSSESELETCSDMFQTMTQFECYTAVVFIVWMPVERVVQMPMKNHERSERAMPKQLITLNYHAASTKIYNTVAQYI